jgi:hypothetical protein
MISKNNFYISTVLKKTYYYYLINNKYIFIICLILLYSIYILIYIAIHKFLPDILFFFRYIGIQILFIFFIYSLQEYRIML